MKKYSTRKMVVSKIYDLSDCNESVNNEPIRAIINQELINKVFRTKKRFKNKYDSKSMIFYIFKGKKLSKTQLNKLSKEEVDLLKMKPKIVQ